MIDSSSLSLAALAAMSLFQVSSACSGLIITGVIDGPLPGGTPKAIELYASSAISDLSTYCLTSLNNGGAAPASCSEFTFPAEPVAANTFMYVAFESTRFQNFFGFPPSFTGGIANLNGDDAVALYHNGALIDMFGEDATDGTGTAWEYTDSWAYRNNGAAAASTFAISDWNLPGINVLDGESTNLGAATPFPIASFTCGPGLLITGVIDGPLPGGTPKAVELYASSSISDLSEFCLTSPNNGAATPATCSEFMFPSVAVSAGTFLYVAYESTQFQNFFGVAPHYTSAVAFINGDDAMALFHNGALIDMFGEEATDGTGTAWEYTDSWAYRNNGAAAAATFAISDWNLPGKNVLDGESTNAAAATPFPVGSFSVGGGPAPSPTTSPPTPAPTALPTPAPPAPAPGSITLISSIQGHADMNAMDGLTLTVEAIVVGDFQTGDADTAHDLGGFFLQEEDADADGNPSTSEGIFISEGAMITDVNIGDLVQVTGVIGENYGVTQIAASSVTVQSTGNALPSAATISFPIIDLERYEGMRVTVSNTMYITETYNLDRYNEIRLQTSRPYQYTQLSTPSSSGYAAHMLDISENSITYDDGLRISGADISLLDGFGPSYGTATTPRLGDTITGLSGILTYEFGTWRIRSAVDGTNSFTSSNPRPPSPPSVGSGNVKLASFNVLNFFDTIDVTGATAGPIGLDPRGADSQDEYDRQLEKLVTALAALDADLLGLVELENDFGASDGDSCALKSLVDALNNQVGAGTYAYVWPGSQYVDSSDAISVGFMYKPSVVSVAASSSPAILNDSVVDGLSGGPSTPLFDGSSTNRASLAVTFTVNSSGECLTVACNHFKSKGGTGTGAENVDASDGAGNWNGRRLDGATAVDLWLATEPTGVTCSNKAILGDLNAYAMEDPIQHLISVGWNNVETTTDYSYVFDGQIGTLDYILLNTDLFTKKTGSGVWHNCEDEPDAIDYNLDYGRSAAYFDGSSPARASDHSPVLVGLNL